MSLQAFFANNIEQPKTVKRAVSSRIKNKEGKPMEWEFFPVGEERSNALRKAALREVKVKKNIYKDKTDYDLYMLKLAVETVTFPDLNNKELQDSYGVMGAEKLLQAMLITGEYANLLQIVNEVNGFDSEVEMVEEAKN